MPNDPARGDAKSVLEAHVEEVIARALAPYRDKFTPDVLEEFAEELRCFLHTHPVGSRMLSRVQPDDRTHSGDQPTPGVTAEAKATSTSQKGKVG